MRSFDLIRHAPARIGGGNWILRLPAPIGELVEVRAGSASSIQVRGINAVLGLKRRGHHDQGHELKAKPQPATLSRTA